jgi:hypothetical protein
MISPRIHRNYLERGSFPGTHQLSGKKKKIKSTERCGSGAVSYAAPKARETPDEELKRERG